MNAIAKDSEVDPDGFAVWGFEQLLHHRIPLYKSIADNFGYTIRMRDIPGVQSEEDFNALVSRRNRPSSVIIMPIRIPNDLPARHTLDSEGVMVMTEASAASQDIRPLQHRPPQPDAEQDQDRDAVRAPDRRDAAAGRSDAGQDHQPHAEEHVRRAHARLLRRLARHQGPRSSMASS
jgi:hypothetical protein